MPSLFVSYRRQDESAFVAHVSDRLAFEFGTDSVFRFEDHHTSRPGHDFTEKLSDAIARCEALLVLIGPGWLDARDPGGARRLDQPGDFVRLEIEAGLARKGLPVLPVLLKDAKLPTAGELPESIRALVLRDFVRVRDGADFDRDVAALAESVAPYVRGTWTKRASVAALAALAAAVVAAAVAGSWYLTRPAFVTITSTPYASLLLDGKAAGTTPVIRRAVDPGEHEVRLELERFAPVVRRFDVTHGSTFEMDRPLRAVDPCDPEALRIVAAAVGLKVADAPSTDRAAPDGPLLEALFPRGRLAAPPERIRLWARDVAEDMRASLEFVRGEKVVPLEAWRVDPTIGKRVLDVPAAVRSAMRAGETYLLRILDKSGREVSATEFELLDDAERATVERELAQLARRFEPDDPVLDFMRVEYLLGRRMYEDAYDRTVALGERVGPRKEVARMALATLDRAGLRGRGWWADWARIQNDAEK